MAGTIRKVAEIANVSPATVSRYFSGRKVVSDELSRRIEDAATSIGYVPVRTTKRTEGVIIVLIPNLDFGYFSECIKEIIHQMPRYNCKVIFLPTFPGDDSYKSFLKELYVIGVIYLEEEINREVIRYIRAKNIRVIMMGGSAFDSGCDMVHINDMMAAYEGMKYLLDMDHREILILTDLATSISSGFQRLVGCKKAMEEYGMKKNEELTEYGKLTFESGYHSMKKVLDKGTKFTAVFAFSDETALGAIKALNEAGKRVPEDISVLGFDGLSISERVTPKLTTIYQPINRMVEWTLDTLCSRSTKRQSENIEYTLPYKLLERDTVIRRENLNA